MKKNGFSLMEVLMVMGIIGVIAAMGISITQKNVEKAYNLYWYTGYKALADATMDAKIKGKLGTIDNYKGHIIKMLNLKGSTNPYKADNGITMSFDQVSTNNYKITMTIPSPKKKNISGNNSTDFILDPSSEKMILMPDSNSFILDRTDLLPFTINDGRRSTDSNHDKGIYSFKEAYCKTTSNPDSSYNCTTTGNDNKLMVLVNPRKIF